MQFKWGGKKVLLHNIKLGSVREVKAKKIEQIKEKEIQLQMIYAYEEDEGDQWSLNAVEVEKKIS